MKIGNSEYKKILIDLLEYIDDICRKNNIKYSLIGGSMIGAVREKGIIPWDDDIDIILIRSEYDRLIKLLEQSNNKKYKLFNNENNDSYYYPFAKLINTDTLLEEKNVKKIDGYGAYIDIFTYNYVPNNNLLRKIHYSILDKLKRCIGISVSITRNNKNKLKNIIYKLIKRIGYKKIISLYNKVFNLYSNKKNSKYIVSNWVAYGYDKEIQKSSNFKEFMDCEFSGINAMITKDYDEILTTTFGDYMIPTPPKDKKTSHNIEAYWKK